MASTGEPWTTQDVANWLMSIDMGQYIPAFRARSITGPSLIRLQLDDLTALNVAVCAHIQSIGMISKA